jgi:hypothetical protein
MKSAVGLTLGFCILSTAVACDNGGGDTDGGAGGPITIGGSATSAGTGGSGSTPTAGTGGTGGGGELPPGVPLTPTDGWVSKENALMIQGAMFEYADPTSLMSLMKDFLGTNACISGTAAKVDMASDACKNMMFTAPATDCYGEYWGAAIGLNLNQTIDPDTKMGGMAMEFDASAIKGFAFNITGTMIPASLRFKIEGAAGAEFCTPKSKPVNLGPNTFMFEDLVKECWKTPEPKEPTAATTKSAVVKIAWQVVTNAAGVVPYQFCVADLRALQ